MSLFNSANAITCTASKKKGDQNFKIEIKVKNKNNVDLLLFMDGVKIEHCKGESKNVFSPESSMTKTNFIYWNLKCDRYLSSNITLSTKGKLKFQEDENSKGILVYAENEDSIFCYFSKNKMKNIKNIRENKIN
jgi:hypothetical protein